MPEEDAPDIIANTFLAGITDEQMTAVGKGFLSHRECKFRVFILCKPADSRSMQYAPSLTAICVGLRRMLLVTEAMTSEH